jgi:hypothetical protein
MWDSYAEPHQFCAAVYGVNSQYHAVGYDQGGGITTEKGTLLGKLYRLAARKTPGDVNMIAMGHFTNADLNTGHVTAESLTASGSQDATAFVVWDTDQGGAALSSANQTLQIPVHDGRSILAVKIEDTNVPVGFNYNTVSQILSFSAVRGTVYNISAPVPEPLSASLLAAGGALLLRRRR